MDVQKRAKDFFVPDHNYISFWSKARTRLHWTILQHILQQQLGNAPLLWKQIMPQNVEKPKNYPLAIEWDNW